MSDPVELVNPVAIPEGPPVPSSATPEVEFDPAYEAFNAWERDVLRPGQNALASGTFVNAGQARVAAGTATTKAADAVAAAVAAESAALTAVTAPGTLANSATSMTIALGEPAFLIEAGKNLRAGMFVTIAAPGGGVMYGRIKSYNNATGAIEVFVNYTEGAGTYAQWTVAVSGSPSRFPRNKLYYYAGA